MNKIKRSRVFVFIDGQNLHLGTSKDITRNDKLTYKGWNLDYKKFRVYLKDKFRATKVFYFIGYLKERKYLYNNLGANGYILVFKPTTRDSQGKPKGNVDAELVLYAAAKEFDSYDKAIIVSGDGDFHCLIKFLKEKNKLLKLVIPNLKSESSLLKEFQDYKVFLERDKNKLSE